MSRSVPPEQVEELRDLFRGWLAGVGPEPVKAIKASAAAVMRRALEVSVRQSEANPMLSNDYLVEWALDVAGREVREPADPRWHPARPSVARSGTCRCGREGMLMLGFEVQQEYFDEWFCALCASAEYRGYVLGGWDPELDSWLPPHAVDRAFVREWYRMASGSTDGPRVPEPLAWRVYQDVRRLTGYQDAWDVFLWVRLVTAPHAAHQLEEWLARLTAANNLLQIPGGPQATLIWPVIHGKAESASTIEAMLAAIEAEQRAMVSYVVTNHREQLSALGLSADAPRDVVNDACRGVLRSESPYSPRWMAALELQQLGYSDVDPWDPGD